MTARTHEEIYRRLREFRDALDQPEGFAAPEISAGTIIMTMSPSPRHDRIAVNIGRQLRPRLAEGLIAEPVGDLEDAGLGVLRRPDALVMAEAAYDAPTGIDPREVRLAVEIVSPGNPSNDYSGKLRDYPAMGIPDYLIVDPRDGTLLQARRP
jgi:Uma2 family endonuclease